MSLTCYIQMDPLSRLVHEDDTTLFLAKEALQQGYELYVYEPASLSLRNQKLVAFGGALSYSSSKGWQQKENHILDFEKADVVLIRQEPPFDMCYITSTYLLDFLPKKCLVLNSPEALRNFPEKIIPHYFKRYLAPTLISSNNGEMENFLKEYKDIVIKPLYLYGGAGVERIKTKKTLLKYLSQQRKTTPPFILQKFLPSIETTGDKRLIFIDGKLEGWYQRRPAKGTFLTNFYKNPSVQTCDLTPKEREVATAVSTFLNQKNIYFAGADLVEEFLLEINTTCTASLPTIAKISNTRLDKIFWEGIKKRLSSFS